MENKPQKMRISKRLALFKYMFTRGHPFLGPFERVICFLKNTALIAKSLFMSFELIADRRPNISRSAYGGVIICFFTACSTLFFAQSSALDPDDIFDSAVRDKQLFEYEQRWNSGDRTVKFSLAKAYFANEAYDKVVGLLDNNFQDSEEGHLLALAYLKNGNAEGAIAILQTLPKTPSIDFDYALALYELKEYSKAATLFDNAKKTSSNLIQNGLAELYQAKIAIEESRYEDAMHLLKNMHPIPSEIQHEWEFTLGELYFRRQKWSLAIEWLEKAHPHRNAIQAQWTYKTLDLLAMSYANLAESEALPPETRRSYFDKAEAVYREMIALFPDSQGSLELAQFYFSKARKLKDEEAYLKGKRLVENAGLFSNPHRRAEALFLLGEAAPDEREKERIYVSLAENPIEPDESRGEAFLRLGQLHLEQAALLQRENKTDDAQHNFKRAAMDFENSCNCFEKCNSLKKNDAIHFQAACLNQEGSSSSLDKSLALLNLLEERGESTPETAFYTAEGYSLRGSADDLQKALVLLKQVTDEAKAPALQEKALFLSGTTAYKAGLFTEAESAFKKVAREFPLSSDAPAALYWAARSLEQKGGSTNDIRTYYKELYGRYPSSELAPVAYYSVFSTQEYLQGDRASLKHLIRFKELFPNSPLLLNALYLQGLDAMRDRKSPEGKWISRKNLTAAIDAFQEVESAFDTLFKEKRFKDQPLEKWITLRYQATLERALANYKIAEDSLGAKRQIYLDYAEEVFKTLKQDFENPTHEWTSRIQNSSSYHPIQEEATYYLAMTELSRHDLTAAEKTFREMLKNYSALGTKTGYYPSKVHTQLGMLHRKRGEYRVAAACFDEALGTTNKEFLTTDEILDVMIEKSLCYKEAGDLDHAMLLLSEVANYHAVSSLRLKAMFLRAEIYESQGRTALARKQLESIALKGGDWSKKAKAKLEREYGID